MLVKRYWFGKKEPKSFVRKAYVGWFLFGIIPLYIKEVEDVE